MSARSSPSAVNRVIWVSSVDRAARPSAVSHAGDSLRPEPLADLGEGHELDWRPEGIADGAAEQTAAEAVKHAHRRTHNWSDGTRSQ